MEYEYSKNDKRNKYYETPKLFQEQWGYSPSPLENKREMTMPYTPKPIPPFELETFTCIWCGKEILSEVLLEFHEKEHFDDEL